MKLSERAPAAASSFKAKTRLWTPEIVVLEAGRESTDPLPPKESDRYAAVDDIGAGIVVLRISRWPHMDGSGRLAFPRGKGFPMTVAVPRDEFQGRVNAERSRHAQAAPDRLLRVGDVFLLRGLAPSGKPEEAEAWDVSAAGRDVAKAAYYGAGAATVDPDYIEQMGAAAPTPVEADPPGTFDIRQQPLPTQTGGQP
ncbi:MAG: hypothetical protein ABI577_12495 [bacterium]